MLENSSPLRTSAFFLIGTGREKLDELVDEEQILFKQYQLLVHATEANDVVDGPSVLLVDLEHAVEHQEVCPPSYMRKSNLQSVRKRHIPHLVWTFLTTESWQSL